MSSVYLETTVDDLDRTIQVLSSQEEEMAKLLVEIVGTSKGVIKQSTASKVYELYIKLAQAHPSTNVQINIESLKGKVAKKPVDVRKFDISNNFYESEVTPCAKPSTDSEELVHGFKNVVLGGTFDRLHVGHKILLTEAVLRCQNKLTVGVTDESMIKNKKLWELVEPVEKRIANVLDFLTYVDGGLKYEVVPISDMFGPTQTDPDLDLLVVSTETQRGGQKVNEVRLSKGFPPLALYTVGLLEAETTAEADEKKISSSNQRLRLLGTQLRPPVAKAHLPSRPYLIGLTGGIASGKSSIGRTLADKGAAVVDCDKVAHVLYKKGTPTYNSLIELFGPAVIAADGEVDRKALGSIVFSSKDELEKLNTLLWPAILESSLAEAQRIYKEEKKEVVVLEAAVLLRAGWHHSVHEVWTCIVPPEEAVDRVVKRNGIPKEAAEARLLSQPSNSEQVAIANVVFCSLYSYDFTRAQVERAWRNLQLHLKDQAPRNKF